MKLTYKFDIIFDVVLIVVLYLTPRKGRRCIDCSHIVVNNSIK